MYVCGPSKNERNNIRYFLQFVQIILYRKMHSLSEDRIKETWQTDFVHVATKWRPAKKFGKAGSYQENVSVKVTTS